VRWTELTREQAIFFEVMLDLNYEGYTEPIIFAYHDFISNCDLSKMSDLEVHRRAKECFKRYQHQWFGPEDFYEIRWDILEQLDLDEAEWEYLDLKNEQEEYE
jgi:hypothetical protein